VKLNGLILGFISFLSLRLRPFIRWGDDPVVSEHLDFRIAIVHELSSVIIAAEFWAGGLIFYRCAKQWGLRNRRPFMRDFR